MRDRLEAIRRCLQLELMAMPPADQADATKHLEDRLGEALEPLLGWRRLLGLVTRLPPVAAAVPVLSALASLPLGGTSRSTTRLHSWRRCQTRWRQRVQPFCSHAARAFAP